MQSSHSMLVDAHTLEGPHHSVMKRNVRLLLPPPSLPRLHPGLRPAETADVACLCLPQLISAVLCFAALSLLRKEYINSAIAP
ncbi:hypothetical protein GQ42DRAFT_74677 [Ramicandelaber brevisporus]|nr:hypothetical protein GQ42DRAFT_74677 [Ramicandelaber brevisporus]